MIRSNPTTLCYQYRISHISLYRIIIWYQQIYVLNIFGMFLFLHFNFFMLKKFNKGHLCWICSFNLQIHYFDWFLLFLIIIWLIYCVFILFKEEWIITCNSRYFTHFTNLIEIIWKLCPLWPRFCCFLSYAAFDTQNMFFIYVMVIFAFKVHTESCITLFQSIINLLFNIFFLFLFGLAFFRFIQFNFINWYFLLDSRFRYRFILYGRF